jgi:DNA replication protein DnaD
MDKLDLNRLKALYVKYNDLHSKLNTIELETLGLINKHSALSEELTNVRLEEKELINKIEMDLGRHLSPEEILNFIQNE